MKSLLSLILIPKIHLVARSAKKLPPHSPPLPTPQILHHVSPSLHRHVCPAIPVLPPTKSGLAASNCPPYIVASPFLTPLDASPVSHRNLHPRAPTLPSPWPRPRAAFPMTPSLHHHPLGLVPMVASLTTIPKLVSHPRATIPMPPSFPHAAIPALPSCPRTSIPN